MSDRATLRRLLREHAEAVSTEIAFIKEDAILRLFDATQSEHDAQVAALQTALEEEGHRNAVFTACLHKAQNLYLEAHPDYPGWPDGAVNITWVLEAFDKERAEVKRLQTALAAANEDAERLEDKLSEVVAYGGYYADIANRTPPDGQTFKVIAVSPSGVDDFTVLRMDGKLYFASDPPREVTNGFEIIRIKPWDVKTFGKTEEEDF